MYHSRFADLSSVDKTPAGKRRFGGSGRDTPRSASARKKCHLDGGTSLQASQIVQDASSKFAIETFGLSLPVLITNTLTLSDRSTTEITACIDPSGWAWLVGGRKLFIWRYKSTENTRASQFKELTLPPSDLAHSAERVCLIPGNQDGQPLACVAVSPEGVVRYWPKVSFETSTVDISAELRGEECARVVNFQPYGCLLATTTSSLLLLEPIAGQAVISCRPLKSSHGLFSGISRRMSSFVFGSSQMETNEAPLQAIIPAPEDEFLEDEEDEDKRMFYVLSDTNLSKWMVPSIGAEKLIYQVAADRMFREALAQKVWEQESVQLPHLKTWLLDIQLTRDGLVMLAAGVNLEVSRVVYFALVYLETLKETAPANISRFTLLDYTLPYSEHDEHNITSFKLLLPEDTSKTTFIYNKHTILCLQDDEALDKMDLKTPGDIVLGAGRCDGTGVFFSNVHGIFGITASKMNFPALNESNNQSSLYPRAELESMMMDSSKLVEMTDSDDEKTKLKGAFIAFISGDQDSVQTVLEDLAPLGQKDPQTQESGLDKIVADVSKDLVDDIPNADPRWAESDKKDSSSSTASVIIIQQLKDKQKAHDYFINFLKSCGLWDQLSLVRVRNSLMSTRLYLCENVEKVEAAIALRELHAEHCKILDPCIKTLLEKRGEMIPHTLTPQDLFYRRVSTIQDVTKVLVDYVEEFLNSDHPSKKILTVIRAVNAIFVDMLHYALKYREANAEMYAGSQEHIPEYIPWTATESIRTVVSKQIMTSLERGVSEAREVDVQGVIFQNVVGLADILMDGYASQIKSLQTWLDRAEDCAKLQQKFEKERHNLILPLVKNKQYDRAASLAEKYEDFEMLMVICDATDNQERLQRYRIQFADKGFAQFLFQWYLKEGKRGHLLSQPVAQGDELSRFLDSDNVKYLSWLHEIHRGNFVAAHHALSELASVEKNFLAKKKTLLSLSKLSAMAADEESDTLQEDIEVINEELDLVMNQELLPTEAVENAAMDPENMRVLTPKELIELYVGDKNTNAGELDVKKALDLLRYIDQTSAEEEYEQLKRHIWCRAILMDDWRDTNETDPLESNRNRVFMKTVDLVYMDGNLESLLPDQKTLLTSPELADLSRQPHFQFLIKGGYEQINRALCEMD